MDVNEYVSNFLRDAQYRISELTIEIDERRDEGEEDPLFRELKTKRQALINFMEVVYDPYTSFTENGYGFMKAGENAWEDREIIEEIEYLRDYTDMTLIPYGVFTGYYPQILNNILGDGINQGGEVVFPTGDYLEILRYNSSGQIESIPFPDYTGAGDLSIIDYFAGRP